MRQAMILAAGRGSRLSPLTDMTPKCLIEVNDRPLVDYLFEHFQKAGILRVVINLWHLGDVVHEYIERRFSNDFELFFSEETELLDTGGGLAAARNFFDPQHPILIHNGDILLSLPLENLFQAFQPERQFALLVTQSADDARALLFDESENLVGWRNRDSGAEQLIPGFEGEAVAKRFCGVQIVSPRIFERMPDSGNKFSLIKTYLEAAEASESILACSADSYRWFDIGTPEQLDIARKHWKEV